MAVENATEHVLTGVLCEPVDETVYVLNGTDNRPQYVFSVPGRKRSVAFDVEAYDEMLAAAKRDAGL